MGISQAEVKLRRLLAAAPRQSNHAKLLHYVAAMREQLALLTGGGGGGVEGLNQDLRHISEAKAAEYAKSIDEVAEKIDTGTSPDVWESLRSIDDVGMNCRPRLDVEMDEPMLAPPTLSPNLRRRRLQMKEQDEEKKVEGLKLDAASNETISKHRQIQEALTDEMALLSEQMKNNSYMLEKTLKDTGYLVDDAGAAVEVNIGATNRVNERAGIIYKSNWKTGCYTWLILILMIFIFIFMVGLIRLTG
ncbi:unconventional SNARE in the endoplasmic reticulum protein 1 [Marchantia polymorpha subsp. ruderalis]|uniref:Vesicle transport protein USE1 n=2 Tax=Marchantia polymorpha TaxID=3197 RepID=A0AAF6ARN6_MARPO|nr:hypothetical protein MARPO_0001s0213 [Marchantia polymorpha]BAS01244.1 unconventional SNARE in the ER 1A [Marchantia polymorpha]BBM99106.1 hypothetical protein Mp_1g18750 [Marchantia polymorpha subsp. ruderalis]|eukprot:PTQ50183.1 hypothetical protein MARPO_0001s0213 [Marchantia polymorpha]